MHPLFGGILLFQFDQELAYGLVRLAPLPLTAGAGCGSRFAAFASTKLPSTDRYLRLHQSRLATQRLHDLLERVLEQLSIPREHRPCRFELRERGVMRDLLIEAQAGEPAPRQMHAQFLHQLPLAGGCHTNSRFTRMRSRSSAINGRTASLAVTRFQRSPAQRQS